MAPEYLGTWGFPTDLPGHARAARIWTHVSWSSHAGCLWGRTCVFRFSLHCGDLCRFRSPLPISAWSRRCHPWLPNSLRGKVTWCQLWVFVETSPEQGRYSGVGADFPGHLFCLFLLLRSIINFCSIWVIHIVPWWNDTTLCFYAFIIKHCSWKNHQVCLGSSVQFIFPKLYFE